MTPNMSLSFHLSGWESRERLPHPGVSSAIVGKLSARLSELGPAARTLDQAALSSLAAERDPEIFCQGLLELGRRHSSQNPEVSVVYFGFLTGREADAEFAVPKGIRAEAEQELRTLRGEGSFGRRLEAAGRTFAREATDPGMLLAMTAGSLVYSGTRAFGLSRLLSGAPGLLTRGWRARALAGTIAFPAEIAAFWGTHRAYHQALHPDLVSWDPGAIGREVFGLSLTLGLLKLGGAASQGAFNRAYGVRPGTALRLPASARWTRPLLNQAGMFAGITAGHWAEVQLGIRPAQSADGMLLDSLVMLAQFGVAGRLSHHVMGPRYAALMTELNLRSEQLGAERPAGSRGEWGWGPGAVTAEGMRFPLPRRRSLTELVHRPLLMANGSEDGKGGPGSASPAEAVSVPLPVSVERRPWDPSSALEAMVDAIRSNRELSQELRARISADLYPHIDRVAELLNQRMEQEKAQGLSDPQRLTPNLMENILHRVRRNHFEGLSDQLRIWYDKYRYMQEELFRRINRGKRKEQRRHIRRLHDHVWRKVWETRRFHHEAESYIGDDKGVSPKSYFHESRYPQLAQRYSDILRRLETYVSEREDLRRLMPGYKASLPSRYETAVTLKALSNEAETAGLSPDQQKFMLEASSAFDPQFHSMGHQPIFRYLQSISQQTEIEAARDSLQHLARYLEALQGLRNRGVRWLDISDTGALYVDVLDRASEDPEGFRRELETEWSAPLGEETASLVGNYLETFQALHQRLKPLRPAQRDTMQIPWPIIQRQLLRLEERQILDRATVQGLLNWFERRDGARPAGEANSPDESPQSLSLIYGLRDEAAAGIIDFLTNADFEVRTEVARFFSEVVARDDAKMMDVVAIRFQNYQLGMMRDRVQIRRNPSPDDLTNEMAIEEYDRFLAALLRTARFYHRYPQARGFFLDVFDKLEWDREDINHGLAIPIWLRSEELLREGYQVDLFSRGGAGEAVLSATHPEKGSRTIAITSVLDPLESRLQMEDFLGRAQRELLHNGEYQKIGNGTFPRFISLHLPKIRSGVSKNNVIQWTGDYLKEHPQLAGIDLYIPARGNEVPDLSDPAFYPRKEIEANNIPSTEALLEDLERDVQAQPLNLTKRWELYRLRRSQLEYLLAKLKEGNRGLIVNPRMVADFMRVVEVVRPLERENWRLLRETAELFPKDNAVKREYQRVLQETFRRLAGQDLTGISESTLPETPAGSPLSRDSIMELVLQHAHQETQSHPDFNPSVLSQDPAGAYARARNTIANLYSEKAPAPPPSTLEERLSIFANFFELAFGKRLSLERLSPLLDLGCVGGEVLDLVWNYHGKGISFRGAIAPAPDPDPEIPSSPEAPPTLRDPEVAFSEPQHGGFHFNLLRHFQKGTIELQFDYVTLPTSMRGRGLGRHFMGELIRLGEDLGAVRIISPEISEEGRYKLAIYGMQFRDRAERSKMVHFFRIFLEHHSRIPGLEHFDLSRLERIRNPQQLAYAHLDPQSGELSLERWHEGHPIHPLKSIPAHYHVGRAFLLNSAPSWAGVMDLGPNSEGLSLFHEYFMDREMGRIPPEQVGEN